MKFSITKHFLYLFFITIVALLGLTDIFGSIHTEAVVLLGFLTSFYVLKYYQYHENKVITLIIFMLSFFLYSLMYEVIGISSAGYSRVAIYLCWLIICLTGIIIYKYFTKKEKTILLYTIYILTMIGTIYVAINGYSFVSQGLFLATSETSTVHGTMIMFFGGICLLWFLNDKNLFNRELAFVGVALSFFVNIYIMQRGITLVLSTLMYGGILLFNGKRSKKNYFIVGLLFTLFAFLYFSEIYIILFDYIAEVLPSERLSRRVLQIKYFLLYGAESKEAHGFSGRLPLMLTSINTWTSSVFSILFGIGDHRENYLLIGNHSEVLDSLARFGIFGACLLWGIVYHQYKLFVNKYVKATNYTCYIQATVIFLFFVLRGLMGTVINFKIAIQVCIFLPLVLNLLMNTSADNANMHCNVEDNTGTCIIGNH